MKSALLAMNMPKVMAPSLTGVAPSQRIHGLLQTALHARPATWIHGAPGSGKTTSVASFLNSAGLTHVWCRMDGADEDLGTLIDSLKIAFQPFFKGKPAKKANVTATNSQTALRLALQEVLATLPAGSVVVIDDVDMLSASTREFFLNTVLGVLPQNLRLLVLGRSQPSPVLERRVLNGQLGLIGGSALRLERVEMLEAAKALGWAAEPTTQCLDLLDGWVAGLALLGGLPATQGMRSMQRYLVGQTLEQMAASAQELVMRLACLPELTAADTVILGGNSQAWAELETLAQTCLFIEEVEGEVPCYRFHPAMRAMLLTQAASRLGASEMRRLELVAAPLLETRGQLDAAAEIFLRHGNHDELAALLERQAERAANTGTADSWSAWLDKLDAAVLGGRPWLQYWHGRLLGWSEPLRAKAELAAAARSFHDDADETSYILAVCAMAEVDLFDFGECKDLRASADTLVDYLSRPFEPQPDAATSVLVHACASAALSVVEPQSSRLACIANRATNLLGKVVQPADRLHAASKLLLCTPWLTHGLPQALVMEFDPMVRDVHCPVHYRVEWCCVASQWHLDYSGDLKAAQALIDTGMALAESLGLHKAVNRLLMVQASLHFALGSKQQAGSIVSKLSVQVDAGAQFARERLAILKAQLLFEYGDVAAGLALAQTICTSPKVLGGRTLERCRFERQVAAMLASSGDHATAQIWSERAVQSAAACGGELPLAVDMRDLLAAYVQAGNDGAQSVQGVLRDILMRHRCRCLTGLFVHTPALASDLAVVALGAGVDGGFVKDLIARQRLRFARRSCCKWPWPVAVRTLGGIEIAIDGETIRPSGKAQQRLLELLHVLVGAGPGGKSQQFLETHLWPDSDCPKATLAVAIHRLRKLLGCDGAVIMRAGNVVLDRDLVWTDAEAMIDLCDAIEGMSAKALEKHAERVTGELLDVYRGAFYEGQDDAWLLAAGKRISTKFIAAATTLGDSLEQRCRWEAASKLYRRVLDVEPLCEIAYRGLMRCAHAQGDSAAAFSFYRFCRDTLSVILGCEPCAETKRLATTLGLLPGSARPQAQVFAAMPFGTGQQFAETRAL